MDGTALVVADGKERLGNHGAQHRLANHQSVLLVHGGQLGKFLMKFSCEKALLSAAVSVTSRAVAAKSSIPAMEGILIEAGDTLRLTGYNWQTGIQASLLRCGT